MSCGLDLLAPAILSSLPFLKFPVVIPPHIRRPATPAVSKLHTMSTVSTTTAGSEYAGQTRGTSPSKLSTRLDKQKLKAPPAGPRGLRFLAAVAIAAIAATLLYFAITQLSSTLWGPAALVPSRNAETDTGAATDAGTDSAGPVTGGGSGKARVPRSAKLADFPDGLFHRTRRMRVLSAPDPADPTGAGATALGRTPTRPPPTVFLPESPAGTHRHDVDAFTQGLFFWNGTLHESTGIYGQSKIRAISTLHWEEAFSLPLPAHHFGEGSVVLGGGGDPASDWKSAEWFVLTWQEGVVHVHKPTGDGMKWKRVPDRELRINTQGWGLTEDPRPRLDNSPAAPRGLLLASDGSHILRWHHPDDMREVRRIEVREWVPSIQRWRAVTKLNELEWIDGYIWANVWYDNRIAVIDPDSGAVLAWIDANKIVQETFQRLRVNGHGAVLGGATLNGIAIESDKVFLTGKQWDMLYSYQLPLPGLVKAIERAKKDYGLI